MKSGNSSGIHAVRTLLDQAVQQRIGSGMAAAWGSLDALLNAPWKAYPFSTVYSGKSSYFSNNATVGSRSVDVDAHSVFDLASLTKILATTSLYMVLHERGIIRASDTLSQHLPTECTHNPDLKDITIGQLLSHTSGLPAHREFFKEMPAIIGAELSSSSAGSVLSANQLAEAPVDLRKKKFYELVLATRPGQEVARRLYTLILDF